MEYAELAEVLHKKFSYMLARRPFIVELQQGEAFARRWKELLLRSDLECEEVDLFVSEIESCEENGSTAWVELNLGVAWWAQKKFGLQERGYLKRRRRD